VKGATTRFVAASPLDTRFNPRRQSQHMDYQIQN